MDWVSSTIQSVTRQALPYILLLLNTQGDDKVTTVSSTGWIFLQGLGA